MPQRVTGIYRTTVFGPEKVRAFFPHPLPPLDPPLLLEGEIARLQAEAMAALGNLAVAGAMVPSLGWFLYGFVRKEAVISSQIEGTQATLLDMLSFEARQKTEHPADVEEVCNYLEALEYARAEIRNPAGLPLSIPLLCKAHERLMQGVRGAEKHPGTIRTSQNWIGGSRPGNARFVPPPPEAVQEALSALERWLHQPDPLPPLIRAGLAHVQFETIHPFLDGNGRVGRLLITLLVEHWGLLETPLLYLSLAFKRRRAEYYDLLMAVRHQGAWEAWIRFFLECVREAALDGVKAAERIQAIFGKHRQLLVEEKGTTRSALRLFDLLPEHPILTLSRVVELLQTSKPTAGKAIETLCRAGILREITGKQRDRVYVYEAYLKVLAEDTEIMA